MMSPATIHRYIKKCRRLARSAFGNYVYSLRAVFKGRKLILVGALRLKDVMATQTMTGFIQG